MRRARGNRLRSAAAAPILMLLLGACGTPQVIVTDARPLARAAGGADPNATNDGGASVYWHAHAGRHRDIQLALLEAGADSAGFGITEPSLANPVGYLRQTAPGRRAADALTHGAVLGLLLLAGLSVSRLDKGRRSVHGSVWSILGGVGCLGTYLLATAHWDVIRMDWIPMGLVALVVVGAGLAGLVAGGEADVGDEASPDGGSG